MTFQRLKPNPPAGSGGMSAYARHRASFSLSGGTINAVKKAIESDRISAPSEKTGWFNFKKADREWKANTQSQFQSIRTPVKLVKRTEIKKVTEQGNSKVIPETSPIRRLTLARAEKAEADAAFAVLQLHEKVGSLVSLKQVKDAVLRINRITRDALLTVPDRIASQVAACSNAAEVHEILLAEIRLALTSLAEMPVEEFWKRSGRRRSSRTLRSSWS